MIKIGASGLVKSKEDTVFTVYVYGDPDLLSKEDLETIVTMAESWAESFVLAAETAKRDRKEPLRLWRALI